MRKTLWSFYWIMGAVLPGCAYTEPQHSRAVSGEWIGTLEEIVVGTVRGHTYPAFLLRIDQGPDLRSFEPGKNAPQIAIIAVPDGRVLTRIAEVDPALVGKRVAIKGVRMYAWLYKPRSAEPFGDLAVHRQPSETTGLEQLILPDEEIRRVE